MVDVLDFEFLAVDCIHFEEKQSKHGNIGFYYKGYSYKEKHGSVYDRTAHQMNVETVYGGSYVLGCNYLFDYGRKRIYLKIFMTSQKLRCLTLVLQ